MILKVGDVKAAQVDQAEKDHETLWRLVKKACRKNSKPDDAVPRVRGWINAEPGLAARLAEQALLTLIRNKVHDCQEQVRRNFVATASQPGKCRVDADMLAAAANAAVENILDEWTYHGVKIGDLTGPELLVASHTLWTQAKGLAHRARFYQMVAPLVGEARMRDRLNHDQAMELLASVDAEQAKHEGNGHGKSNGHGTPDGKAGQTPSDAHMQTARRPARTSKKPGKPKPKKKQLTPA